MMNAEEIMIKITSFLSGDGFAKTQKAVSQVQAELTNTQKILKEISGKSANVKMELIDNSTEKITKIIKMKDTIDDESVNVKLEAVGNANDELNNIQNKIEDLEGLSPTIKPTVDSSEVLGVLDTIQDKIDSMGSLESGVTGILGTVGAEQLLSGDVETATNLDKAWRNWVGSLQQTGISFDQAKGKADQFKKTVNQLASQGQSNDALFKNVAGLAINLNNQISDSTLQMTEKVVAGYEMLGGRSGATLYEMEKELKNFLSTGELGLMEDTLSSLRDPAKWKGLLEGADTVDERIKVLNEMLAEEGIMGALNIDAPSKSIDSLKAIFDAAMTNIGTALITFIKPIADAFTYLDSITNGLSTTIISGVAVIGLLGVGLAGLAGALGAIWHALTGGFTLMGGAVNRLTTIIDLNTIATKSNILAEKLRIAVIERLNGVSNTAIQQAQAHANSVRTQTMAELSLTDAIKNNSTVQSINNKIENQRVQAKEKLTVASIQQSIATSLESAKLRLLNGETSVAALYQVNYQKAKERSIITSIRNIVVKIADHGWNLTLAASLAVFIAAERIHNAIKNISIATTLRNIVTKIADHGWNLVLAGSLAIFTVAQRIHNFVQNQGILATIKDIAMKGLQSLAHLKTAVSAGIMTAAQIGLNAAMMAMPYALIIAGLIALGAAFKYLYDMFPDFGNGINQITSGLKELFGALMSGDFNKIGDIFKNAFAELPNCLGNIEKQAGPAIKGMIDAFSNWASNIDWLGLIQKGFGDISAWIVGAAKNIGNWFVDDLKGISEGLSDWLAGGGEGGQAAGQAIYDGLVGWWQANGETIVEILSTIFLEIIPLLGEIGLKIAEALGIAILQGFEWLGQQIAVAWENNVAKPFWDWLNGIPGWLYNGLMGTLNSVIQWGLQLAMTGLVAGAQFVTNIITFISQLPGQIWAWLVNAAGRISAFSGTALARARTVGTNILNGIKQNVSRIPQMGWDELMRAGDKILSAGSALAQKARQLGESIWKSVKDGLGIGSPGHIYYMVEGELGRVHEIFSKTQLIMSAAYNMGQAIVSGFGNPVLPRIENEGVAPWDINYEPGKSNWNDDYLVPSTSAVVLKNDSSNKSDNVVNVELKQEHTWHIDGGNGDPQEIAKQVEQTLAASLPASIVEAVIKGLNKNNISNGND